MEGARSLDHERRTHAVAEGARQGNEAAGCALPDQARPAREFIRDSCAAPAASSVMTGHSRLKDGVALLAYARPSMPCCVPNASKTWMPGTRPGMTSLKCRAEIRLQS